MRRAIATCPYCGSAITTKFVRNRLIYVCTDCNCPFLSRSRPHGWRAPGRKCCGKKGKR